MAGGIEERLGCWWGRSWFYKSTIFSKSKIYNIIKKEKKYINYTLKKSLYTLYTGSFCVSVIHLTLSVMDYRIFNVHMWSFLCVFIFWLGKALTNFSCAPDWGRVLTSGLWISSPTLYQLSCPYSRNTTHIIMAAFPSGSPGGAAGPGLKHS